MTNELITNIKSFHNEFRLAGHPQGILRDASKPLMSYFITMLREDTPLPCPSVSDDEWAFLIDELSGHGLIPLLYLKLAELPETCQPPREIKARFKQAFLKNNLSIRIYLRQFSEVLAALRNADVDVIVLKGLALAWSVYPHFGARPFGDIDLLVKPEQFLLTRKLLYRLGYRARFKRFENYRDICKAEEFYHAANRQRPLKIDLHWSPFDHYGIRRNSWASRVFCETEPVQMPGVSFRTLNPADALIHTSVHLTLNHSEGIRLIWLADIAFLTQRLNEIYGWTQLERKIVESKTSVAVGQAVKAAQLWFNVQIPDDTLRNLPKLKTGDSEKMELNYAVGRNSTNVRIDGYFRAFSEVPNKFRFLVQFIFPAPEYVRIAYPPRKPWMLPLSYCMRWVHWLREFLRYLICQVK